MEATGLIEKNADFRLQNTDISVKFTYDQVSVPQSPLIFCQKNVTSNNPHMTNHVMSFYEGSLKFREALLRNDFPKAADFIRSLAEAIQNQMISIEQAQYYLNQVILILTSTAFLYESSLRELKDFYVHLQEPADTHSDVAKVLTAKILPFTEKLCSSLSLHNNLMTSVEKYIQEHYSSYDFSVQAVADAFNLTLPELSRMFKNTVGKKISNYVWEMRLNQAKQLLASNECSVKEIVELVGYVDASSFSRKFKNDVGCSPGEYRLKCMGERVSA